MQSRSSSAVSGFSVSSMLRGVAGLASVLFVAALSGCASDNYYCDNTGCYRCDGVGCRPVQPPSRATCAGDWDCRTGQVCTSLGCATTCTMNANCPEGWQCLNGLCATPSETPVRNPGSCTTNANCPGGRVCLNGTCQTSTQPTCTSNTDCTNGNVCVSGRCTPPSNTCQFNNQCGLGRVCVNSECRSVCASGNCPVGQQCVQNGTLSYCADGTTTGQCTADAMCPTGNRCFNGRCVTSCTPGGAMTMCPTDYYCTDDGVCGLDTRPRPFCDATHPCGAGSTCVSGVCRVPCSGAQQCAMVDVSYTRCSTIPNQTAVQGNFCLTEIEFRPTCSRQADCSQGQSCIDGACR